MGEKKCSKDYTRSVAVFFLCAVSFSMDREKESERRKMETVFYLVRHGEPFFENGQKICLGNRSDPALSTWGREQAKRLADFLDGRLPVFCSPLLRSRETALYLSDAPQMLQGLMECGMGPWDGMDFESIRREYPLLYAQRADDPSLLPEGAEPVQAVCERMRRTLDGIAHSAIVVGHAGAMRAMLCPILGKQWAEMRSIPMPYGSVTKLLRDADGAYRVEYAGRKPQRYPGEEEIARLYRKYRTPETVTAHCGAVASLALGLGEAVGGVDCGLLYAAAKLHDLCRAQPRHADQSADALLMQGYPEIARIVRQHHSPSAADGTLDECALLFYADKRVQGARLVSLEERFRASLVKCGTPQALEAHREQREAAQKIERRIRQTGCWL